MEYLIPTQSTEDEAYNKSLTAILPIGSFEQHGPYLPLATDTIIACTIAKALANTYPVQQLPPISITCSHEHSAWPGTVSISAATLYSVIFDIHKSLQQSGTPNLVLINAHGGNYVLKNIVQEATVAAPRMALFPTSEDWEAARAAAELSTTDHADMHAGELETSILLHAHPGLVRPGYAAGDHTANERPALLTLGIKAYSTSGIIGQPSLASATKGKGLLTSLVDSFEGCLTQLTQ
jgi:creatinine amidohydrolase